MYWLVLDFSQLHLQSKRLAGLVCYYYLFAVLRCYTSILLQYHFKSKKGTKSKKGSKKCSKTGAKSKKGSKKGTKSILVQYHFKSKKGTKSKKGSKKGTKSKKVSKGSYADGGDVYGTYGRHLLLIVWQLELYSHCVEVIISEDDNLTRLFPGVSFEWAGVHLQSLCFGILTALIALAIVQFRRFISYLSAFRVVVTVLMVVSLIFLGTEDGVGFHPSGSLVNWHKIPFAFQFYSSCYSGHSVFPKIPNISQSSFKKALLFSSALATAIYVIFGSLGYLMFGEDTQSQITLNLPKNSIASIFANITMVIIPLSRSGEASHWFSPQYTCGSLLLKESQEEGNSFGGIQEGNSFGGYSQQPNNCRGFPKCSPWNTLFTSQISHCY